MSVYTERCGRAQALMQEQDIPWLVVPVSTDLQYLTGFKANPSERLTLLCLPASGKPTMILPRFEVVKLERAGYEVFYELATWVETESPYDRVHEVLGVNPGKVAISEKLWSVFLLGIQERVPRAQYTVATPIMSPLRMRKDEAEVESLREVGRRMDQVFAQVCELRFAGRSELEVAGDIFQIVKDIGLSPTKVGGVASGPNSTSPHHLSTERVIEVGDSIWLELGQGGSYNSYIADKTRSVHVGEPSEEFVHAYNTVRLANEEAFRAVRLGVECQEIDRVARRIIEDAGLGEYFTHRVGHGLGLDVHEPPYMVEGNTLLLDQGMVFSIEPGVYVPGRFGLRIEDIIIASSPSGESIYASTHDLIVVE